MTDINYVQSTLFVPPNSNDNGIPVPNVTMNPAGFGTGFGVTYVSPIALTVGQSLAFQITCPRPAPLWALSTAAAGDNITIRTTNNAPITLQPPNSVGGLTGFNNGYFQPAQGSPYLFYYKAGAAVAANGVILNLQAVVENTIGQYIDLGSITPTLPPSARGSGTYEIGTTTALNSQSALPNCVFIEFMNYPVIAGLNILATARAMITAQANITASKGGNNAWGANWLPMSIVGGQTFSFEYRSQHAGLYSGRISVAISNIGSVSLPPTLPMTSMTQAFMLGFEMNADPISFDADPSVAISMPNPIHTKLLMDTADRCSTLERKLADLTFANAAAHSSIIQGMDTLLSRIPHSEADLQLRIENRAVERNRSLY